MHANILRQHAEHDASVGCGVVALIDDLAQRGTAQRNLIWSVASWSHAKDQPRAVAITGKGVQRDAGLGGGTKGGLVYGSSDATASGALKTTR